MNEQAATRAGSDVARLGWSAASDRRDAPRPDAVRSELPPATRPRHASSRLGDQPAGLERDPGIKDGSKEPTRDATFPTSYARFAINAETQKLSIKIVDAVTDEVIREIPPEQVQRIAEDLQSLTRRGSIGRRPADGAGTARSGGGGVDRYV